MLPDDMYITMLKVVLEAARAISTHQGTADAELEYGNVSRLLSDAYLRMFQVPYTGSLLDYLDAYTELDLNWIPHLLIWRERDAKKGTPSYMNWIEQQGVEPGETRQLDDTDESCLCSLPPADCVTGGIQVSFRRRLFVNSAFPASSHLFTPGSYCMHRVGNQAVGFEELIQNGSFEDGIYVTADPTEAYPSGTYANLCDGCPSTIEGWTVKGTLNRHNSIAWTANDGDYSVDLVNYECGGLDGSRGSLQQSFSTLVGEEYVCSLSALAPSDNSQWCNLPLRKVDVTLWDGESETQFAQSTFEIAEGSVGWERKSIRFSPPSTTTIIKIESGNEPPAGFWGVAVDSVSCRRLTDAEVEYERQLFFANIFDWLKSCFIGGAASTLPSKTGITPMGVDFLVNAAAVADLVGGQGVRNSMYAFKTLSCGKRLTAFAEKSFSDPSCMTPYTTAPEAYYGCQHSLNCGMPGHPVRAANLKTPDGFYFKDAEETCHYISWKDLMNGGVWCGGF